MPMDIGRQQNEDTDWQDRMNEDWEAAATDDEKMAVLRKYMSPDQAWAAFAHLTTGKTDIHDQSEGGREA